MNFELETKDIEAIASLVIERLLPVIRELQQPDRLMDIEGDRLAAGKGYGQLYQWVNLASHGLSDFPFRKARRSLRFSEKAIREWIQKKSLRR